MTWRRRALSFVSTSALGVTALVGLHTPAASAAPLDLSNFRLEVASNAAYLKSNVARLDAELPNVGVGAIMAEANRTGTVRNGAACNPAAVTDPDSSKSVPVTKSLCFEDGDNGTADWFPQGVTTVADAQADQLWGESNQPVLVSWYFAGDAPKGNSQKGVRVTFMDPKTGRYRHVLLVHPYENSYGNASYTSVRTDQTAGEGTSLHAGGIVWYGNFLYVADTGRGFRVFDMRHIYDLKAAGSKGNVTDKSKVGRINGVFYGYGYRYVMPEVTVWRHSVPDSGTPCTSSAVAPKFSFAGLDRSGIDHLVAGEYCNGAIGRVFTWKIADAVVDGEQRTSGYWNADSAYNLPTTNVQGATRFEGRWYVSQSHGQPVSGQDDLGELHTTAPVTSTTGTLRVEKTQPAAIGVEDLSHWPGGAPDAPTLGTIWSVSEHRNARMVYATTPR